MAAPKGNKFAGSRKGVPNKTTGRAKEVLLAAIDEHSDSFSEVMNRLKKESPAEYARIFASLFKYVIPAKSDVTTDGKEITNDKPINIILPTGEKLII